MGWSWHLEFIAGDLDVGVFAAPELTAFLIEDGDGRFEIEATPARFPQALADRLADAG